MTLRSRRTRSVAATCIVGLAASGAAVLGVAAPASAAATLTYNCDTPLGAQTFTANYTLDGDSVAPGETITPEVDVTLTIPASLADQMRFFLGTDEISGEIAAATTVDGVDDPSTLVIPPTPVPSSGDVPVEASGPLSPVTGGELGDTLAVATGDQVVTMLLSSGGGEPTTFEVPCTPAEGQNLKFGSIDTEEPTVSSATKVKATYAKKAKKATVTARVTADGAKPTGKVAFVVKKGKKTVAKKAAPIRKGAAKAVFKVTKKGKYTVTATYKGTDGVTGSKGKGKFTVR